MDISFSKFSDIIEKQIVTPILMNCESQFTDIPIMWDKKKGMIQFFKIFNSFIYKFK